MPCAEAVLDVSKSEFLRRSVVACARQVTAQRSTSDDPIDARSIGRAAACATPQR